MIAPPMPYDVFTLGLVGTCGVCALGLVGFLAAAVLPDPAAPEDEES